jgi:glycosyltransferase involved in cell wall biosynthesis
MGPKRIIVFVDRCQEKMAPQINAINNLGFESTFFVSNTADSLQNVDVRQISSNFLVRLKQVVAAFKEGNIHHIEVYPGGRFGFLYILLSKVFRIKSICVERGDLLYYHKNGYGWPTRLSMYLTYKYSNIVWYKEPYMLAKLQKIGVKKVAFIHNVARAPLQKIVNRNIDFIWVNRIISERYSDWFVRNLRHPTLSSTNNYLLGMPQINNQPSQYVKDNKPENLIYLGITKPDDYFLRSKFFVLFSSVIFANHSLLEAMSYGVIPIVNMSLGADLIVQNNVNGFIVETEEEALATMQKMVNLDSLELQRLSNNSTKTISENFSPTYLLNALQTLYTQIENI